MKRYLVVLEKSESGYGAYVPDLPGCVATAPDKEQVEELIYEAIRFHIDGLLPEGLPVPAPTSEAEMLVFAD